MRYLLAILFLSFGLAYGQVPIHQWLFDNNPADSVGSNDGVAKDGATYSTTYKEATHSLVTAGGTQRVVVDSINLGNTFSWSFWLRLSSTGLYPNIITNWDDNWGFSIWILNSNNRIYFRTSRDGYTNNDAVSQDNQFTDDVFTHIVVTANRTAGSANIYVNGNDVTSDGTIRTDFINNDSVAFMADREGENPATGYLDNVQFYNYIISESQIDSLYTEGATSFYLGAAGGSPPPEPGASSDTTYVDYIAGNDTYAGTKAQPIKTLSKLTTMIDTMTVGRVIALSDTLHPGTIYVNNTDGTSDSPYKLITWNKYGTGNRATIDGYKTMGTFTEGAGERWTITDGTLDANYWNYITISSETIGLVNKMNYLLINNVPYPMAKYPATGAYTTTGISTATPGTYIEDTGHPFANGYWTNALVNFVDEKWVMQNAKSTYSSNRHTFQAGTTTQNLSTINDYAAAATMKYFISNHANALASNGDWYYDHAAQTLGVYHDGALNSQVVKFPNVDSLLMINASDYWIVDGVKFRGGTEFGVKVVNGANVTLKNNLFQYMPVYAVLGYSVDDIVIEDNEFEYCISTGIRLTACDNETVQRNTMTNIGKHVQMIGDREQGQPEGIASISRAGTLDVLQNRIDSVGYNGIRVTEADASLDFLIYGNYVSNFSMGLGDAGGIYIYSAVAYTDMASTIRKNLVTKGGEGSKTYMYDGRHDAHGIYTDGLTYGVLIDSNTVTKVYHAYMVNGNDNQTVRSNTAYYSGWQSSGTDRASLRFDQTAWGGSDNTRWAKNLVIMRDSAEVGFSTNLPASGTWTPRSSTADSNYYYHPFNERTDMLATLVSWGSFTRRTLTYYRSNYGFENNGRFNNTDWTYQDISGITRDQFVWVFYNWSSTPHDFSLGDATFTIPSSPGVVSENVNASITVDPYESQVLFYRSGSIAAVDDPIWVGSSTVTPTEYEWVQQLIYRNTTQKIRIRSGEEQRAFAQRPRQAAPEPEDPYDGFTIYNNWNFESLDVGTTMSSTIAASYFGTLHGGYNYGMASIVNDNINGAATKVMRIYQPAWNGTNYLPQSGAYAFEIMPAITPIKEVYVTYNWKFGSEWQATNNGKMTGMGGLPIPVSGVTPVPSTVGWKYRTTFGNGGALHIYYYDHSSPTYGTSSTYSEDGGSGLGVTYLVPGNWYNITERYVMNSSGGSYDGIFEMWINGKKHISMTGRNYWNNAGYGDYIRYVLISHFHGGASEDCWPTVTTYGYIDNIKVWIPEAANVTGNVAHSNSYVLPVPDEITVNQVAYDTYRNTSGTLSNSEYGGTYSVYKDETWLIDAGAGRTVTFSGSYGLGDGDYLFIQDGNTTESTLVRKYYYSSGSISSIASSGRYLFIRFVTDKNTGGANTGFTGTITFN